MQIYQFDILHGCPPDHLRPKSYPKKATCAVCWRTTSGICGCKKVGLRSAWLWSASWTAPMFLPLSVRAGMSPLPTSSGWPWLWTSRHGFYCGIPVSPDRIRILGCYDRADGKLAVILPGRHQAASSSPACVGLFFDRTHQPKTLDAVIGLFVPR